MENENIREDANLNEEMENTELEQEESCDCAEECACDETEQADEADFAEEDFEEIPQEEIYEAEPMSEEEIAAIAAAKKAKKKKLIIISSIVAAVVLLVALWFGSVEGFWEKNIVTTSLTPAEGASAPGVSEAGESAQTDNIKYENPFAALINLIAGKDKDAVMYVNGMPVDVDVFTFATNTTGINNVYSLIQTGLLEDVSKFDWNSNEATTGMSYLEFSKAMAAKQLVPMYALAAEAEKHSIGLDDSDEKELDEWINELKSQYGDEFETVLMESGYPNEAALVGMQRVQMLAQKVYDDATKDLEKYASKEEIIKSEDEEKVTVKHILIAFDESGMGDQSDEKKAEAKRTAEEVLAKVKAGEDFDKLVEEYNDDPGASENGYTFAANGQMVPEFEEASFALQVGETSELVETTYGYHIIKRIERNVTADDYMSYLQKNASVRIKRGNFNDVKVTLDLNYFFGPHEE